MAQRLSLDERARVEAMITAGVSVAEAARRLERDPSTIHRELALNRDGAYDAEAAQAAAAARARRPKTPKLAADAALAATVGALLAHRMSPHAISALVAGEGACGCRKLCRSWSGGISVLVDESVTAGRFHDLEVSIWLV